DVTAGHDVTISTHQGNIVVGDTNLGDAGDVLAKAGNVSINTDKGNIGIVKTVTAQEGSIDILSGQGDILIGNNGPDVKTVTAKQNIDLTAKDGKVVVYGKTSTEIGDISITAHREQYIPGEDNSSFIIDQNGKLEAGGAIHLNVGNGDLHVSDRIQAKQDLVTELEEKGGIYFDTDVNVAGKVSVKTTDGDIYVGHDVRATQDIVMAAAVGTINVGATVVSGNGNVNLAAENGDIAVGKEVRAEKGSIGVQVSTGNVTIGDNGPDVETVTAQENINIGVDVGKIYIYGKTSTQTGDISMAAGNSQYKSGELSFVIEQNGQIESGRDVLLNGRNGDLHVTDRINAKRDLNAKIRSDGGIYFEKEAVVSGNSALAGNFIYVDGITANNGGKVFHFSMTGTDDNKLIGKEFYVGTLRSKGGTEMLSLWGNSGYLHVDEGNLSVADVLAVDKIYLDNAQTDLAIYGRTPTRDGEQLAYWNNLGLAYSKERSYQLYTDGMLRTHGTVLVDCGRYYTKLYGDNLSVVDMMRERDTNVHGKFTFDGTWLTRRANAMKQMSIDMDAVNADFLQKNDVVEEVVVD
ncbi:MAG: hypothetical protein IIY91_10525, partial [Selenomonas sp.]|nr:hypothetical protein [Selenomonas sp.]